MSKNELIFEKSITPIIGKLIPDEHGYVTINAGAYGVFNTSGQFYDGDNIEKLFEDTSLLRRRIDKGVVFSELGHPDFTPGMTLPMYESRLSVIKEDRYCGHIRKASLIDSKDGKSKITRIEVCPYGHYASTLQDMIKNPYANGFFSVRSISNRQRINGILVKYVHTIITWDYVTEGGILTANKGDTLTDLESMSANEISKLVVNQDLVSIDLNNTADVKHTIKHFEEFRRAVGKDLESAELSGNILDILKRSAVATSDDMIFNWK